jgi:hypothetical protein
MISYMHMFMRWNLKMLQMNQFWKNHKDTADLQSSDTSLIKAAKGSRPTPLHPGDIC